MHYDWNERKKYSLPKDAKLNLKKWFIIIIILHFEVKVKLGKDESFHGPFNYKQGI